MKTQLALPGDTTPEKEVERARLVREAVGPHIDLLCDINQRWGVHQAMDIGKRVEDVHFFWLEDVTTHDDYSGLARVAGLGDAAGRRRMFVWHHAVSSYDRSSFGRYHHDRFESRRRHFQLDEGRRA